MSRERDSEVEDRTDKMRDSKAVIMGGLCKQDDDYQPEISTSVCYDDTSCSLVTDAVKFRLVNKQIEHSSHTHKHKNTQPDINTHKHTLTHTNTHKHT